MNWRDIWHPSYGNYGGGYKTSKVCCVDPIDEMDTLFKIHDIEIINSTNDYEKYLADSALFSGLKDLDIKSIKIPVYGHLYLVSCLFIFGIITKFGKPKEKK